MNPPSRFTGRTDKLTFEVFAKRLCAYLVLHDKNMAKLLGVAKRQARNEDKVVCEGEIGDIIKLLWTNRNKGKRESYRQLVSQSTPEEEWENTKTVAVEVPTWRHRLMNVQTYCRNFDIATVMDYEPHSWRWSVLGLRFTEG